VRKRLLLLITDLEIGGTPTVVRELAVRLRDAAGIHVEVACLSHNGPVGEQLAQAKVPVNSLNARGVADWRVLPRLIRLIRHRRIDTVFSFLVHANTVAAAASVACRNVRWFQSIQTSQPNPRWHWLAQAAAQQAAEKIIVPSQSVAAAARDWSDVPAGKIIVIPNAIDPAQFNPLNVPTFPATMAGGPFPVGFIGRLDPIKRVPDLLEAVARLAGSVQLHVFGEGIDRPRIERGIAELGIASNVTLHGRIVRPQDALHRIGLLVLPSQAEGFGLVLIEAMAAGVPVIATNVPGIRDVVRDGQTGLLVPVASPAALAAAIRRLIDQPALRASLIRRASQDVRDRFAWPAVIQQYVNVLDL
jgi:glycosyltransferase involved in cell wall biosynthesis